MKLMKIGRSEIEATVIGLGAWAIGGDSNWGPSDDAESIRTIHKARELGITLLDTAPGYGLGHSEEVVGKALEGRRQNYILATKCGVRWDTNEGALLAEREGFRLMRNTKAASMAVEIEQSLKRLKTDYIDIYIVHWQALPEFPVPISETMEFLMKLKKDGKIRAIGASNLSRENLKEYITYGQLDLIQEKYSMLDQAKGKEFFDLCDKNGIVFQCYSPLERGILTGKYKPDTPVNMAGARQAIKWFQKENLAKIAGLTEKWTPLCKKYDCTMINLVVSWTAAQGNGANVNVLIGARTAAHVVENVRLIILDSGDIKTMLHDVEAIS
jgi:methylglyoxal reductase